MFKDKLKINQREAIVNFLIQHFEADFLWKVSLEILNSGITLKTFTHEIKNSFTHEIKNSIVCLFDLICYVSVHSYGYVETVSSPF